VASADLTGVYIGIDVSHNASGQQAQVQTNYQTIQGDLANRGANISVISTLNVYPNLAFTFDILWIEEDASAEFLATEFTTLSDYVSKGGCIFFNGDEQGTFLGNEALNYYFGLGYSNTPVASGPTNILLSHPITEGVSSVYVPGSQKSLNPTAFSVVLDSAHVPVVAVTEYGAGRVIVSSDEDILADSFIALNDNRQLANNLFDWCVGDPVALVGLEMNQAVQDLKDSVFQVQGKRGWVRAHLAPRRQSPFEYMFYNVEAVLHGERDGQPLPGSPLPMDQNDYGTAAIASHDVLGLRGTTFARSANFSIPSSWRSGTIIMRVEGVNHDFKCKDEADVANDCKVTVTFEDTKELEIKWIRVQWKDGDGNTFVPTDDDITEQERRLKAIFPIASGDLDAVRGFLDIEEGPVTASDVNVQLELVRANERCSDNCSRIYYGLRNRDVDADPSDPSGQANAIPGTVANGIIGGDYVYNLAAHELGHVLDRHHAVDSALGTTEDDYGNTVKQGYCGEDASTSAPDFPYFFDVSGDIAATIGPLDQGDGAKMAGMDTYRETPRFGFELMSYCGTAMKWISDFTYKGIRDRINAIAPPPPFIIPLSKWHLMIGKMNFSEGTVQLLPFTTFETTIQPAQMPAGPYALVLRDSRGSTLQRVAFQPRIYEADILPGGSSGPRQGSFLIPVPFDERITSAEVQDDRGSVLASRVGSANSPIVRVAFPNQAQVLTGDTVEFSWVGTDSDGDALSYTVQVSTDCGETFETVAVAYPDTALTVPLDYIRGTDCGLLRVQASDGFNTAEDVSDQPFTIPNRAPRVSIARPANGAKLFGDQPFALEGGAFDTEDGSLSGEALMWESDLDGALGSDEELLATLSVGTHRITLIATDSEGGIGSDTVTIDVVRYRAHCNESRGFWKKQYQGKGKPKLPDEDLDGYLNGIRLSSTVFEEEVPLADTDDALLILNRKATLGAVDAALGKRQARVLTELLVGWLNLSRGGVGWRDMTDSDRDGTPDKSVRQMIEEVEAVLNNPHATKDDLSTASRLAKTVNKLGC
jgi:hypothetical protein